MSYRVEHIAPRTKFERIQELKKSYPDCFIDLYKIQWYELEQILNPGSRLSQDDLEHRYKLAHLFLEPEISGNYVWYPWSGKLVHILEKSEFLRVRTSRNIPKISLEEQEILQRKTIGIIGLSVGATIAKTLMLEGIGGTIKLADFDTVDLSNLNRLDVPLYNCGQNKAVLAARVLQEINPYLNIEVFADGYDVENPDPFFGGKSVLDLLIEECDSIHVKFHAREQAKKRQIPVIMETNDRGMLDIERFDLEPDREIFHGLVRKKSAQISNLAPAERIELIQSILDWDQTSAELKYSFSQLGKSILTWPQLASSVMLGGALVADAAKRILLGDEIKSGRYYNEFTHLKIHARQPLTTY